MVEPIFKWLHNDYYLALFTVVSMATSSVESDKNMARGEVSLGQRKDVDAGRAVIKTEVRIN